jgi:GNAT superfamily N-acetyltransferase
MRRAHGEYELDDDRSRIDVDLVHRWLSTTYWSPGVARDVVERALRGSSMVVGAYHATERQQVGVLRVVSDKATFAWVADVFVDESHRKQGLARAMLRLALDDPQHQGLRRWVLATKDAHGVYEALGFVTIPVPERWMWLTPSASPASAGPPLP